MFGRNGISGVRYPAEPVRVQHQRQTGLAEELTVAAMSAVGGLLGLVFRVIWRHRVASAVLVGGLILSRKVGWPVLLIPALALTVAALLVRHFWPVWWATRIGGPIWRYRRRRHVAEAWPLLCRRCDLELPEKDRRTGEVTAWTPRLSDLHWTTGRQVLAAHLTVLPGQTVDQLADAAEKLAAACSARWCRIRQTGPATAEIAWLFDDPLAAPVTPLPVDPAPDLAALPVGLREDGEVWRLRLAGTHLLLVGVTGAGKSSMCWSLLRAMSAGIAAGLVQVWAVDGKGGMELAPGRALFSRFAATIEDGVDLLEDAAALMTKRARGMAGDARTHIATVESPTVVVLVDEVALLTAYQPDRKLRDRAEKALALLAAQGRAPGVVLVAALQDPRKEVLGLRNLFPSKIALRLDEKQQVDMVLGGGAREAGADCHKIPDRLPGVGYVKLDGHREPVRVRAAYLSDDDIAAIARQYPTPTPLNKTQPVDLGKSGVAA